jgi:hypothetical protein
LQEGFCYWSRIMIRPIRGSTRVGGWVAALIVLGFATTPLTARAQFPGMGWGYGYPAYGYGYPMYGSPYGLGFGFPGVGFGYGGMGYGFGYPGFAPGLGYPGLGFGMGYGFGFGAYGAPAFGTPLGNPLFGAGLTPLAVESFNIEANVLGRRPARPIPGGGAPLYRLVP